VGTSEANDSRNKLVKAGMDVRRFQELCQRLDELAAILEIMECDPINADLHREASNALNQALSEIERLRSEDQRRETSNALRDALAEIKRLQANANLQHKALRDALGEIERLRSDADQHRETSNALQNAVAEIERLRSDVADLHPAKFDRGLSNSPPASIATDWFMKFLERKHALIGKKVTDRKSGAE
jgi:DNA repair exonuclease SbcCD ATPase subunit